MDNWNELMEYCDLTYARYGALKEAAAGMLKKMNGAQHVSMMEMIGPDFKITEYGRQVLERAEKVKKGEKLHQELEVIAFYNLNTAQAAYWLRKQQGLDWIASVHIKLVRSLYMHPGQAYGHLVNIYGYKPLAQALKNELVKGELRMGFPFEIGPEGLKLVDFFMNMLRIREMQEIKAGTYKPNMEIAKAQGEKEE